MCYPLFALKVSNTKKSRVENLSEYLCACCMTEYFVMVFKVIFNVAKHLVTWIIVRAVWG